MNIITVNTTVCHWEP